MGPVFGWRVGVGVGRRVGVGVGRRVVTEQSPPREHQKQHAPNHPHPFPRCNVADRGPHGHRQQVDEGVRDSHAEEHHSHRVARSERERNKLRFVAKLGQKHQPECCKHGPHEPT
jgi:hypothetical protein